MSITFGLFFEFCAFGHGEGHSGLLLQVGELLHQGLSIFDQLKSALSGLLQTDNHIELLKPKWQNLRSSVQKLGSPGVSAIA